MTLKADAATVTSHSATVCNRCSGGSIVWCHGKITHSKQSISTSGVEDEIGTYCWKCQDNDAKYLLRIKCSKCSYYKAMQDRFENGGWSWDYSLSDVGFCSSCISGMISSANKGAADADYWDDNLNYYLPETSVDGHHKYDSDYNAVRNACSHGQKEAHTTTCSNSSHSSYSTTLHYYCTSHGYLGTDSTCPGLAVTPTPSSISLYFGQEQQITPNQQPTTASVSYTSSDENIAPVSSTGLVTSVNKGNAIITVTATL